MLIDPLSLFWKAKKGLLMLMIEKNKSNAQEQIHQQTFEDLGYNKHHMLSRKKYLLFLVHRLRSNNMQTLLDQRFYGSPFPMYRLSVNRQNPFLLFAYFCVSSWFFLFLPFFKSTPRSE